MRLNILMVSLLLLASCTSSEANPDDELFQDSSIVYKGMDLSFQSELESYNVNYKNEAGDSVNLLDFAQANGSNLVRLKLWHTPRSKSIF